jgi:light-regulated signal transduction histidine kinase (bacteriophytochrome)
LLRVLLVNLLGNAWKFTAKTEHARLDLGLQSPLEKGAQATFFVCDNGAGFDMTYADKLFAPFQRFHDDEEFEGTGIGLATVQRVVARHGGRIWADAAVDRGATFFFTLAT